MVLLSHFLFKNKNFIEGGGRGKTVVFLVERLIDKNTALSSKITIINIRMIIFSFQWTFQMPYGFTDPHVNDEEAHIQRG